MYWNSISMTVNELTFGSLSHILRVSVWLSFYESLPFLWKSKYKIFCKPQQSFHYLINWTNKFMIWVFIGMFDAITLQRNIFSTCFILRAWILISISILPDAFTLRHILQAYFQEDMHWFKQRKNILFSHTKMEGLFFTTF